MPVTLFRSYNQFYRAECITVSGFFFLEMIDADPRNYLPMIASRRLIGTEQDKDGVPKKRTLYVDH